MDGFLLGMCRMKRPRGYRYIPNPNKKNITFIGNCQTMSLCYFFQKLLGRNANVQWCLYADEFRPHLLSWTNKVNKITEYNDIINILKRSDVIIYQEINTDTLKAIKKEECRLIKIPSIYLDYSNYKVSICELQKRETQNDVDIKVSDIFEKHKGKHLCSLLITQPHFCF